MTKKNNKAKNEKATAVEETLNIRTTSMTRTRMMMMM